jgi:two-component system cell cycle sensor histidine kinase/response regulator CckA
MMTNLCVLLIEPDSAGAARLSRHLAEADYEVTAQRVDTAAALQAVLSDSRWQVVIAWAQLPALPPTAVLDILHTVGRDLPLLVVDDHPRIETAVSLLKAGASDYLTQDDLPRLGTAVRQAIAAAQARAARTQQCIDTAIRAYELWTHTLLAAMHDLVMIVDENGRFLEIIPTTPETLYVPREEALGKKMADIFPPDKANFFNEQLRLALANQLPVETEYSLPMHGREAWFKARFSPLPDKTVLVIISDITTAKQAEADIQHEKALSDSLINSLPGIFYLFNEEGQFLRWNENFEKIGGYSAAEFNHLHPLDLFTDQDKALIAERIGEVFQTGRADAEASLITKDGRRLPYYFTGARIQYNNTPCLIGMGIDIGERLRTEKSLLELKQAVDTSGDVIFLTDRDGIITTINAQFTNLYGYTAAEVVGKTTPRILKSGQQDLAVYERFWQLITSGHLFRGEVINKTKDGRFVTIEETVNPFQDQEGNITGFLAIQRDVTAQRETEQALQETRDFLEMALIQSPSGILIASAPDVTIQMANPAAFHIRGGDPQSLTNIDVTQLTERWQTYQPNGEPYPSHELPLSRAILGGERVQDEIAIIRDEAGNDHWVSVNAAPIRNPQGEIFAGIVIFHDITERKQAEDELRRQSAALASAANAIIITNIDGIIEWANPAYTRLTGYEMEEMIGQHTRILKSGRQTPAFYQQLWDTVLAGEMWQGELVNRRKDGTLYSEEQTITPLRDENGVITHFIAIKQDITERKQHQREQEAIVAVSTALRAAATRAEMLPLILVQLDALLTADGTALVMVSPVDGSTTVAAAHGAFAPALGSHRPAGEGMSHRVIVSGQPFITVDIHQERDVLRPELFRQVRAVACVPLLAQAQVIGAIWIGRQQAFTATEIRLLTAVADITANAIQRATLYEQTRKQAEQITQIMHSVPDGVLLLDADHRIVLANPPAREYLTLLAGVRPGDTLSHLAGRPLNDLLTSPPTGRWHDLVRTDRTFEMIASPLPDDPTGWVLVLRDVSEQRLVQRQLYEQERLAAIGRLAAGIAHDFNNLLAIIILYTELVAHSDQLDERNRERLTTIREQANRAAHMVKQILDFSRRSTLERQPLDLVQLVNEQIELLERTLPVYIELAFVCELDELLVLADATRLQQVIMNLAVNARDVLPQGGRLTLELSRLTLRSRQEAPVVDMSPGRWACLRVTDTGEGIPAEHLDRIFEPFFTTKTHGKGTGLGLAQVYGIVVQHGGHITITSHLNEGSTFTIFLPELMLATDLPLTESDDVKRPLGNGELVLVVEDNETLRASLVEYLHLWHYRVLEAVNGEDALTQLAGQATEIDLILCDVVMPQLGGVELFRALNRQEKPIPVILMSGHSLDEEQVAGLQNEGLSGWLPKPLDMDRLAQMMAAVIAR